MPYPLIKQADDEAQILKNIAYVYIVINHIKEVNMHASIKASCL